jgi:hypothetical protein
MVVRLAQHSLRAVAETKATHMVADLLTWQSRNHLKDDKPSLIAERVGVADRKKRKRQKWPTDDEGKGSSRRPGTVRARLRRLDRQLPPNCGHRRHLRRVLVQILFCSASSLQRVDDSQVSSQSVDRPKA